MPSFVYLCTALLWSIAAVAKTVSVNNAAPFSSNQNTVMQLTRTKEGGVRFRDGSQVLWSEQHRAGYSSLFNATALEQQAAKDSIHSAVSKRTFCYSYLRKDTDVDGNPHQNYRFQQVSDTRVCDDRECALGPESFEARTEWSSSSSTKSYGWTSAGFSVGRSTTSEGIFGCSAEPHEKVCIWYQTDLTAYTVDEMQFCGLSSRKVGSQVLYSPNNRQCGLTWHCRRGDDCAFKGATYDIKCGPAGAEDCDRRQDGWGENYYDLPAECKSTKS